MRTPLRHAYDLFILKGIAFMNFNKIIDNNETLSNLPYIWVVSVMIALLECGYLKETINDR